MSTSPRPSDRDADTAASVDPHDAQWCGDDQPHEAHPWSDVVCPGRSAATTGLPPLDSEGVLWIAAIECFPIEERIAWVAKMKARVDEINAGRATYDGDPPGAGWSE